MLFNSAFLQRRKKALFYSISYEHLDVFSNFFFTLQYYNLVNNKPEQAQSTAD
jgi:hypothetical protein